MAKGSRRKTERVRDIIWQGEKFVLPAIGKGRDIPESDKIKLAEFICMMYATDDYSLKDCLKFAGVKAESTWYLWCNEIEAINDIFINSQKKKDFNYRARIRERALTMFERVVSGYTVDVEKNEFEKVPEYDEDGNKIGEVVKKTKSTKHQIYIRPSVGAILKAMENNTFFNQMGTNIPDGKSGMDALSDQELQDRYDQLLSETEKLDSDGED